MSRIFISHSGANNAQALALAQWLEREGWHDYFLDIDDTRGIAPGERWLKALTDAVDRCEAVIFLISPAWRDSKYCFAEFFEAKKLGKRLFGVIVEPIPLAQLPEQMTAEWQMCDLTLDHDPLPITVAKLPWVPQTTVAYPRAALMALARGLRKAGLDAATFAWPPESQPDRSPYPGLRALDEADAAVFFGRDALIVRGIDQLRCVRERGVEQLFVILGASGSGKSSFLRAGLLPRLKRDSEHFIVLPTLRPETAVLTGAQGLLGSLQGALAAAGESLSIAQLREALQSGGLAGVLQRLTGAHSGKVSLTTPPTLLLPIDQSEELFVAEGHAEARQFIDLLAGLRARGGERSAGTLRLKLLLLLTLRSDSLPRLQTEPALQALSPVLFSLPAMPVTQFPAVIEGPAQRHTEVVKPLVIEPALVERLVSDAGGADALPLLALTLEWLYREFTSASGTRIGEADYLTLGGEQGIIDRAVQHAFEQPANAPAIPASAAEQIQLLQRIFPHICTVDPDTGAWKRRAARRQTLRALGPQADAMVARLIEQRLLRADARASDTPSQATEVVEVAHEALLRQWQTLRDWLSDFAAALSAVESLRRAATEWQRQDRDPALLVHTAHRLQAAQALLGDERLHERFEPLEREYVAACHQRDQREADERQAQLDRIAAHQAARDRLQRRAAWGLSVFALAVLGLGAWIVMQTRAVSRQTSLVLAGAAELAADGNQFDRSLRLAVLAARTSWLHPAHPSALPILSRAADTITLIRVLRGHTRPVLSARFSPDGTRIVTASTDKTARIWDARTGKAMGSPMPHELPVRDVQFSPDGALLATASDGSAAQLWDAHSGKPLGSSLRHANQVVSIQFSRDGSRVVTASLDGTARIWDIDGGKPVGLPLRHGNWVNSARFDPGGTRIVTASDDKTARVWDATTGEPLSPSMRHNDKVVSAEFSPDGTRIVTASLDGTARLWRAEGGQFLGRSLAHRGPVRVARYSPDGGRIATASDDNIVRIWNADSGKPLGQPMAHGGKVTSILFNPGGTRLVTASYDGSARQWDAVTGRSLSPYMRHPSQVFEARFSPDGTRIVTASADNTARVWNVSHGPALTATLPHGARIFSARFSPAGERVVTASFDNTARTWNTNNGQAAGPPLQHPAAVLYAEFSPDAKRVVTAALGGTARVWNLDNNQFSSLPVSRRSKLRVAHFGPDGKRVVTAADDGTAQVWDTNSGKPLGPPMRHGKSVHSAQFSLDGKYVVTASDDATARVWDAERGVPRGMPMQHGGTVNSASFSPDGTRIVTASWDKSARIWDTQTGKPLGAPMQHARQAIWARFSPDGKRVVTASIDQTTRVWDAKTGNPVSAPMRHGGTVNSAHFSPDSKRVVTAANDATTRIWDAETGKPASALMRHDGTVRDARFSPDGKRLLTSSYNGKTAQVWTPYWPLIYQTDRLILEACQYKLPPDSRRLTADDLHAAPLIGANRENEDVCGGIPYKGPVNAPPAAANK